MPIPMRLLPIAALVCCQASLSGCASVAAVAAAHPGALAAVAEFLPIAAVMGGIGLIGIAGIAGHQGDAGEPGTLGALLNEREASVAAVANAAMLEQREPVLAAALEADRAIVRARVAFRGELNRKPEALGEREKMALAGIDSSLARLGQGTPDAIKDAGDKARALAGKLELPAGMPQVHSFGPHYLFSSLPFQSLTIRGDFPARYPEGVLPRVTINGKSIEAHSYDAQSIAFTLRTGVLGTAESQATAWTRADLSIPWDTPRFDSFKRAGFDSFVVVGLLPHAPGRVTMERRLSSVRSEEAARTSNTFSLGAGAGELEQAACLTLTSKEIAEGWKVKPGSGSLAFPSGTTPSFQDLGRQSEDERSVCWRVRLVTSGSVDAQTTGATLWSISALLRREVREWRTELETVDLAWGGSRVFNYPAGTWTLRYAKYGGKEVEFTGADRSSPLFRVDADARSVRISAYPF